MSELLVVCVILAILVVVSIPSLNDFLSRNRITTSLNQVVQAIHMARETAIFRNKVVTLCPSSDGITCNRAWQSGMLLFIDTNNDRRWNHGEEIIFHFKSLNRGDQLYWRAFRARPYLLMQPRGRTAWQNGTFTYCPTEGLEFARGIILNAAGRIRLTQDENGDGIDEGANGKPLRC